MGWSRGSIKPSRVCFESLQDKDWDRLIPFLLFSYREVPQESTGFSLFELVYEKDIQGPLDVLKESWEAKRRSDRNVVSYIVLMREKLEDMSKHVQENLRSSWTRQKAWYNKHARERSFEPGDQVLVLLPTSASKLTAHWQGPYSVMERVGAVNYRVRMSECRKKQVVFHIYMLWKWHPPSTGFLIDVSKMMENWRTFHHRMMQREDEQQSGVS